MATIQFFNGHSWDTLPKTEAVRVTPTNDVVCRLADLRAEWQKAAESEGKTLIEIQASVGLLLSDICDLLELTPEEIQSVLGSELREAV